jgi:CDGSH-type Zn-finger protein
MTFRKHTTVVDVVNLLRRHELVDVSDRVVMCRCGRWFNEPAAFSGHLLDEAEGELTARTPPSQTISREVLAEVAEIHRQAPDGEKIRQVAEFLGVAHRSAGTYVSRARKAGLLEAGDHVA